MLTPFLILTLSFGTCLRGSLAPSSILGFKIVESLVPGALASSRYSIMLLRAQHTYLALRSDGRSPHGPRL